MSKFLLVVNFETNEHVMSWEILPGDRDVRHFLDICLEDIKDARVTGFVCQSLDKDISAAIEGCETVSKADAIAFVGEKRT